MSVKAGDRVCYTARFLRSIGCYGGDTAFRRGVVTPEGSDMGPEFVKVRWDDDPEGEAKLVRAVNICKVGSLAASDAYVK